MAAIQRRNSKAGGFRSLRGMKHFAFQTKRTAKQLVFWKLAAHTSTGQHRISRQKPRLLREKAHPHIRGSARNLDKRFPICEGVNVTFVIVGYLRALEYPVDMSK